MRLVQQVPAQTTMALRVDNPPPPPASPIRPSIRRTSLPECYDGNPAVSRNFVLTCKLYFVEYLTIMPSTEDDLFSS